MWILGFPVIVLVEVVYLIRHPKTFSGLACGVGLLVGGLSYLFLYLGKSLNVVYLTQVAAVGSYYWLKLGK